MRVVGTVEVERSIDIDATQKLGGLLNWRVIASWETLAVCISRLV